MSSGVIRTGYSIHGTTMARLFTDGSLEEAAMRAFFGVFAWTYSWTGGNDPTFRRNLEALTNGRCSLFSFRPVRSEKHMADYYLNCAGLPLGQKTSLAVRDGARMLAKGCLQKQGIEGRDLLFIHPGSGSREKNWPLGLFYETADYWRGMGGEVAFLLGPAEIDFPPQFEWPVLKCQPLDLVAAMLSQASAYLGNDSGVTHLAAAVGITTFALFRCSDPDVWAPRGENVLIFSEGEARIPSEPARTAGNSDSLVEFLQAKTRAPGDHFRAP